jgi:serine protease Do
MAVTIAAATHAICRRAEAAVFQSFSGIAEEAIPGVVNIRTKTYVRKEPALDLYQFFLQGRIPTGASTSSLGSGVILDRDGFIITNYHVIKDSTSIEVLFAKSKRKVTAAIIGFDTKTDLALLQVSHHDDLKPLSLGDSEKLHIGDIVLAIGNPFGFSHTVTSGIISAMGRVIGTGPYDNFLQTDASIHPGNSGGPLIDVRGRVIGINTAVSTEGQGIGFAIPINMVKSVVRDLRKYGKVIRPWLGVVGKSVLSQDDVDTGIDASGVYGVIITNLIISGPAHGAGFKIGDLIMGIGDQKVYDFNMLQRILSESKPADQIRVKIYRRGKGFLYLNVGLEEIPKNQDLPNDKDLF